MKTKMNVMVLAALLVSASLTRAAVPKSLIGTWKIESLMVNGKEIEGRDGFIKGAVWNLKKNGMATIGSIACKWSYDADDRELVLKNPNDDDKKILCPVTSQGKSIKIQITFRKDVIVITLTPD